MGAQYEQESGEEYSERFDCKRNSELYAECFHADYLLHTTNSVADLLVGLAKLLLLLGFIFATGGVYSHYKDRSYEDAA